jgi:hypothetical protein
MIHPILYVTSFAEDMYNASGKTLINSFIKYKQKGDLLVCYENFDFLDYTNSNIISYDIAKSEYLINWLEKFKDYIPDYLGGTATEKENPNVFDPANRRASRWFRKIAALEYAHRTYSEQYTSIIWIDADCEFIGRLSLKYLNRVFNNNAVFYYLGKLRKKQNKGVESGFIGFTKYGNFKEGYSGYDFLKIIFDIFESGKFLKYERWDDGFIFKMGIFENLKFKTIDIAVNNTTNVMNYGIFTAFIRHNKGFHARSNILI